MPEKIQSIISRFTDKWKALEKQQQIRLLATVVVVVLSLGITVYLATKPKWEEFVSNRPKSEIALIQTTLNELGYKNRPTPSGTGIEIESKFIVQAGIDISTKEIPTDGVFTFQNALDVSGMGSTEVIKKASLVRAKASELSQNMSMFDGVLQANVTLAIPETNNFFVENSSKPTASVVIEVNKKIDELKGESMAKYLAASVIDLALEDIEIIDDSANIIYSGIDKKSGTVGSEDEIVLKRKNEMENQIKILFAPLYDDVKISSNLVFNWDKNKVVTRVISPPIADSETGLPIKATSEKQSVTEGAAGAEPGIAANNNNVADYNIGSNGNSALEIKNITNEYGYNEEESINESSVGKLIAADSAMVIAVYKYKQYYQETLEKSGLLQDTNWEDFKLAQKNVKLDVDPDMLVAATNGTGISNISIISYEVPVFIDKVIEPLNISQLVVFVVLALLILLLAYGLVKTTKPEDIEEIEPELTVEDLLVSTKFEEEAEEESMEKLRNIEFNKGSESKNQIDKFVNEKPEAVAQLLRNWLNDEWE